MRLMAAGALSFSVMTALIKAAGGGLPLFEIVTGRSLVVALLAGTALRRQGRSLVPRETGLILLRALLGFAALSCYFYSVIHLPLADATVIYFTNPVLTAVAAAWLLRERMTRRDAGLVLLGLGGVLCVARPGFLFGSAAALDPVAVGLGLASAFFGAAAYVTIRRMRHDPPLVIVFWFAVGTVVMGAPIVAHDFVGIGVADALLLAGIGVATHLGQLCITWGFRLEPAGRASAVGYLQIVFAALWGWLLFGEVPGAWTWVGAAVIVTATLALARLHGLPDPASPARAG
ncbi:MAG TPA: DMT family transporter [Longimicrobiales bacterium]|nr:DMT family transporter [Longimicrobiales bacterium]